MTVNEDALKNQAVSRRAAEQSLAQRRECRPSKAQWGQKAKEGSNEDQTVLESRGKRGCNRPQKWAEREKKGRGRGRGEEKG